MDNNYSSDKLYPPLDQLVGYLRSTPLIIEPKAGVSSDQVITEMKNLGGKVKNISFGGILRAELPLRAIYKLAELKNIEKIRFDGDYSLLKGYLLGESERYESKWLQREMLDENFRLLLYTYPDKHKNLDKNIIELLFRLIATSVIVRVIDRFNDDDRLFIEKLGGEIKSDLDIINSYGAELPLEMIEELAKSPRVVNIWYDSPLGTVI